MATTFILGSRLLPKRLFPFAPSVQQIRLYALSRFSHRTIGFGRNHRGNISQLDLPSTNHPRTSSGFEEKPFADDSHLRTDQSVRTTADSAAGLRRLLLNNDELVVTRQLEMLNIFMGFEQSNKYVISNVDGESLGYIIEEPRGFLSMFARQVFRTHRPFRALVIDLDGSPILWIRRPFSWINSRMYIQRPGPGNHLTRVPDEEPALDTFAEVQQEWHPWRRRYDLFLRSGSAPRRVLTTLGSTSQPEQGVHFDQFARIDEGLWAWDFVLRDAQGEGIASVYRAFRGFGREILTDTGQYNVSFRAPDEKVYTSSQPNGVVLHKPGISRNLTVDDRALILATAINIDYDYFSRHSQQRLGYGIWWHSGE